MSPYCTKTPTSIDSTDPILLSSTSNTPPSPPPSPLRAGWNSGLNTRPSSKVLSKRRCSGLAEDRGNEPHLNHISGHNMTSVPQLGVKNGKAFSGTSRQRVGHSNSHEQVSNVGSNAADSNAAILASNGYRSPSEILQKLHTQTFNAPTPKKKRYFEVDPSTGEERITERMDGPVSTKGGSEKRVYPVPGYAPLGHSHSNNNLHPIGGSASPLKTQISLGFDDGDVDPRAILSFPANFSTPESACYRKEHICESPTLMSRAVSAAEEEKPNGAGSHGAKTFARALSPEVALTETAFTARSVSSTLVGSQLGMSCAAETSTTPLATTLSAPPSVRGTVGSTSERSGCAAMLPTLRAGMPSQPGQINGLGLVEPITAQLLLERPLNEVSKDALLEKGKRRREPPTPLSLADNAGNFATLASSRERRQLPSTPAAGKMPTTPATPVRAHSRKNSYSLHATHPFLPEMRPLSPISPPPEDYVSCVPPDASDRIIGTHVSLYTIRNSGAPPPDGLPRRRIKGAYRPHLETDKPDLGDFVVLKYSEATYWQGDRDAEDTRLQSGDEGETSSTDVERWSGGNVKGPKNRSRRRAKPKCKSSSMDIDRDVMPRSSPIPNNDVPKPNHDLSDKSTLKFNVKNNNSNSSSVGKGRNTGVSAGTGNMDLRVSSRLARKLSSLISQDKDSQLVDNGYEPRVGISASRQASRGGIPISPASGQLSTGRPQCMSTKCHIPAKEMSSVEIPVATASSPYPFISDTEISSDEDIIPATSAFGHGTATTLRAPTETSLVGQSREQRKQDRINAVKFTEGGPAGEGFRQGSTSIFSVVQLAIPGIGVMGPPAAKVSPAEYKLYIGRKGDQAPLFGSGGNTVIPGLGSGPLNDHIVVGGDSQYGGSSLFQPGGIVDVRRVEDPLLEATMEVKRLIYENGHQGGLVPAQGILGGLSVEKVYWSGEREASLTKPLSGIGVDFSGRPLVKALTFSNPLTNHSYTLSFVWAFLPVNTPEKNKENAVGNSMLLSDEVKGEGASNIHSDDILTSFQVHLCVGKPGRVQKKEERKRTVFVQYLNAGKGGKSSKNALSTNPTLESIRWERWELDGLMRGLTRLWLERTKPQGGSKAMALPRTLKRGFTDNDTIHLDDTDIGDSIGNWLEQEILGLESELPNGRFLSKPQAKKAKILQDQSHKPTRPAPLPPASPPTVRIATVQTTLPMYLQAADSRFTTPGDLPPPLTPPLSPRKRILNANGYGGYGGVGADSKAVQRGNHRKEILMKELSEALPEVGDAMLTSEEGSEFEFEIDNVCWW